MPLQLGESDARPGLACFHCAVMVREGVRRCSGWQSRALRAVLEAWARSSVGVVEVVVRMTFGLMSFAIASGTGKTQDPERHLASDETRGAGSSADRYRLAQASGELASRLTDSGSSPEMRSARVVASSTARRLARTAIQTSCRCSAVPW